MHLNSVLLPPKVLWISTLLVISPFFSRAQTVQELGDLADFKNPGPTWQMTGKVKASLENPGELILSAGNDILVNYPTRKKHGQDLYTVNEYGDMELELDYLMARGSNSGIYLQGRYELQLLDSWGVPTPSYGDNGGIYERWDSSKPKGSEGYEGRAPRQNVSRAPGVWQHLKVSFRAPRFDASGNKTENAVIEQVVLNGALIHENVVLSGPTRGAMSETEAAKGPLRFQGDHGAVAFRNIRVTVYDAGKEQANEEERSLPDPIFVDAPVNTNLRSFMDIPGGKRVVHSISAGSREQVHYTYDLDHGSLFQVWRGGFLDATPMWHSRGDGSSRPRGAKVFLGEPVLALSPLASAQANWPADTTGSSFVPDGYTLDEQNRPVFNYQINGAHVTDASRALDKGEGLLREITVTGGSGELYHLAARSEKIEQVSRELYLIGDNAWYIRINDGAKPVLREKEGQKELIIPVNQKISYSILF
ncbi:uncharacterized protein DUF1080 [Anseongella ginsenosidimutans]|uniref:Uncharacterized protein DUF1080 n=1 Tax=Anseongella ginsenosidimutans TaxID=496056 RepID=A0A4R3KTE5_9SPHI|nr:DUF1080 domain-containing protein [Anseongella ginsenosidimutans]QEC53531.1 DUF1080 domain-containing protein [Anseongella ginsenosidimutans]TCS88434.1 uncharacterized protein DUF1080 [Anseongella ginsenosidimutans]